MNLVQEFTRPKKLHTSDADSGFLASVTASAFGRHNTPCLQQVNAQTQVTIGFRDINTDEIHGVGLCLLYYIQVLQRIKLLF